ncbi:hypothetical protein CH273_03335 [Rhodococcus sp. 05-339-2]|nr:hypothetical protein CH273_03335 [Rhodococcus sp. 05-339-2]
MERLQMYRQNHITRVAKLVLQPTLLAQVVTVLLALIQIVILARFLPIDDFARYGVLTAIWAIGNAVIGTSVGARVVRTAVSDSGRISFTVREVLLILAAGSAGLVYALVAWNDWLLGLVSALTTASFVIAEARSSLELGRRDFKSYLLIICFKATIPVVIIASAVVFVDELSLTVAMSAILLANLAASAIRPRNAWCFRILKDNKAPLEWIGLLNLGLWIVSGVGRIAMDGSVAAADLAVFTLSYSLTDRAFRALQNAYITKNIATAFSGRITDIKPVHWLITILLFSASTATLPFASQVISDGKYETAWMLAVWISSAGSLMYASAPFYLRVIALNKVKLAAAVSLTISVLSAGANFWFVGIFGIIGSSIILATSYGLWLLAVALISRGAASRREPASPIVAETTSTRMARWQ